MLRLAGLRVDGNPAGALYAMVWGKSCYFYQSGFSPEFKSLSPGTCWSRTRFGARSTRGSRFSTS
ncbi:MAG: Protein involved in cellulose biosynthesis (CelD) [Armatimonadetes bacterium OLB18]|nr:MAG: Protein involved in cellulose biosynthesis (CelD) [Armatimonadetes bacterium OLB18]